MACLPAAWVGLWYAAPLRLSPNHRISGFSPLTNLMPALLGLCCTTLFTLSMFFSLCLQPTRTSHNGPTCYKHPQQALHYFAHWQLAPHAVFFVTPSCFYPVLQHTIKSHNSGQHFSIKLCAWHHFLRADSQATVSCYPTTLARLGGLTWHLNGGIARKMQW